MNFYLIGYRCTGKTTVGKTLAAKLGRPFVDADTLVMEYAGRSIRDIVVADGWEEFRRLECRVMDQIDRRDRCVVATGGGVVLDGANVRCMKNRGICIWLKASPDIIASRMQGDPASDAQRPALTDHGSTMEICREMAVREPLYRKASHYEVDTDVDDIDAVAMVILGLILESTDIRF